MRVLGIDPGASGGIALLHSGQVIELDDVPAVKIRRGKTDKAEVDPFALRARIAELGWIDVAVVEAVGGISKQSASSSFNFGRAVGMIEGVLAGMPIRTERMAPIAWRTVLRVPKGDDKDPSLQMARRLWPSHTDKLMRKKDADRAEAALIALAWWNRYGQGENRGVFG